jgi:hypothetical protein
VLQIRLDLFDRHDIGMLGQLADELRTQVKLTQRRIVIDDDGQATLIRDVEKVTFDFQLANLPVIRRDDDRVVVAHIRGDARVFQALQRGYAGRGNQRGASMLADLVERDFHDPHALG